MFKNRDIRLAAAMAVAALLAFASYFWLYGGETSSTDRLQASSAESATSKQLTGGHRLEKTGRVAAVSGKRKPESCSESLLNASVTPVLSELTECLALLLQDEEPNIGSLVGLLLKISDMDLHSAFSLAMAMPPSISDYVFPALITYAAEKQPQEIRLLLSNLDLGSRFELNEAFYLGYAKKFPHQALDDIRNTYSGEAAPALVGAVLEQWSKDDAEQALEWFRNEPGIKSLVTERAQDIEAAILINLIEQDILLAEEKVLSIENGPGKSYLLERVVNYWAELNGELAMDWAKSVTDTDSRSVALSSAIDSWVNVGAGSEDILALISREQDHSTKVAIATEAAASLGNKNPQELAGIYDQLPTEARENVREQLIKNWVGVDIEATRNWVNSLDTAVDRDIATKYMVSYGLNQFSSPSSAVELAQGISDAHLRFEVSMEILQTIAVDNPEKARALSLEMDNLTSVQQAYIRELLSKK